MKTRWHITVETIADNLEQFDNKFFKSNGFVIDSCFIVGVVKEVEEDGK